MASTTVDVILSVVDRITAPITAIQRRIDRLTAPVRRVAKVIGDIGRAAGIEKLAGRLSNLGSSVANVGRHVSSLALGFGGLFALGAGAGLSQFISVNAEFEKFGTVLETVLGSADKAKSSLAWISDFAAKTPYDLAGVTDAFVKLTSYGLKPMDGALLAAGNAAAAMGKPLNQAVEALADAMTGENERLKEFGITTEKTGKKIKYNWVENGKQMTAFAEKNSRKQIEAVVTGIWNRQYKGAMDKLSTTWEGMTSNLGDQWARFMLKIGDAGAFKNLEGILEDVLHWFDRMAASGNLDEWAKSISDSISGVADSFREFLLGYDVVGDSLKDSFHVPGFLDEFPRHLKDFTTTLGDVAAGFKSFYAAMQPAIDFVGGPGNAALLALGAITFGPLIASLATLGVALIGVVGAISLPVIAIMAGIALLGGAVYALYAKWDEFAAYWTGLWGRVADAFNVSWTSGILETLKAFNPLTHVLVGMNALIEFFTGIDLLAEGDRIIGSLASGIAAGAGKLFDAGSAAMQGLLDGLATKFAELKAFVSNAIAEIAAMMPDWAKGAIGGIGQSFSAPGLSSGDAAPNSPGGQLGQMGGALAPQKPNLLSAWDNPVSLNIVMPDVSPASIAPPAMDIAPRPAPSASVGSILGSRGAAMSGMPAQGSGGPVQASEIDAASVSIGTAAFPEPIIANQPQTVNAPFNAGGVVVNVQGMTKEEGQAMVQGALAASAAKHAANVRSALED